MNDTEKRQRERLQKIINGDIPEMDISIRYENESVSGQQDKKGAQNMTHEQIQEWTQKKDQAAFEVAKMAAGLKGVTFAGALDILERAKKQIEREMRRQAAVAPKEAVDEWGEPLKIEKSDAGTPDISKND